ncbi:hypothetical protein RB595_008891 [Gaeumannomyces hyphopodioides]
MVGLDPTDLGFLDEIYRNRETCSFCRLIYYATHSDTGPGIGHDGLDAAGQRVLCRIEWHLDSRKIGSKPTTRRLRVFNEDEKFAEIYVITPGPASGRIEEYIPADLRLLSKWHTGCLENHANCHDRQTAGSAPFLHGIRVIDAKSRCLRDLSVEELSSSQVSYAALSYVWGHGQQFQLTRRNYHEMYQPGYLEATKDSVPKTVLHGILVTQQLGINYIWIDALCVFQDNMEDKSIQISMMDRIFQRATLTLCIAAGEDSHHGIPGIADNYRDLRKRHELCGSLELTTLRPVASLIRASKWDSRAWTFQERLLSTRCAIFTSEGMVWQCSTTTWREDIEFSTEETTWTLDSVGSPLQALLGNPLRSFSSCVNLYSGRLLTHQRDKLDAFNGLSETLGRRLRSKIVFGLPSRYFDWGLLWEAQSAGRRIDTAGRRIDRWRYLCYDPVFPSWSWCGWDFQVDWRPSTVGGPLQNLHDWLVDHTWVVWYIAAHEGLGGWELVWNPADVHHNAEPKLAHRWDGYRAGTREPYGRSEQGAGRRYKARVGSDLTTAQGHLPSFTPPQPSCLLFQTFTAFFSLSRKSMSKSIFQSNLGHGIRRFGITDKCGDWCGTIVLNDSWLNSVDGVFEFAAISEAKEFTLEELDTWTYYIPEERQQAEWYCFYALMLKWFDNEQGEGTRVAERVGLAKIFQSSFFSASFKEPSWKWIMLQ